MPGGRIYVQPHPSSLEQSLQSHVRPFGCPRKNTGTQIPELFLRRTIHRKIGKKRHPAVFKLDGAERQILVKGHGSFPTSGDGFFMHLILIHALGKPQGFRRPVELVEPDDAFVDGLAMPPHLIVVDADQLGDRRYSSELHGGLRRTVRIHAGPAGEDLMKEMCGSPFSDASIAYRPATLGIIIFAGMKFRSLSLTRDRSIEIGRAHV